MDIPYMYNTQLHVSVYACGDVTLCSIVKSTNFCNYIYGCPLTYYMYGIRQNYLRYPIMTM